jgi:hypothetical protein
MKREDIAASIVGQAIKGQIVLEKNHLKVRVSKVRTRFSGPISKKKMIPKDKSVTSFFGIIFLGKAY